MAEEKKKKATPKKKTTPKTPAKVKLIWTHNTGKPGDRRACYGLMCIADQDGVFSVEVDRARADLELKRQNLYRFQEG